MPGIYQTLKLNFDFFVAVLNQNQSQHLNNQFFYYLYYKITKYRPIKKLSYKNTTFKVNIQHQTYEQENNASSAVSE